MLILLLYSGARGESVFGKTTDYCFQLMEIGVNGLPTVVVQEHAAVGLPNLSGIATVQGTLTISIAS